MAETKVLKCSCNHKGQDRLHGKYMRVHNMTLKGDYRCTVCGAVRSK